MKGKLLIVDLVKGSNKLGLSLAGNKDRNKMSVFVCGMHPRGLAYKDGRIRIGDELLEVIDFLRCIAFFFKLRLKRLKPMRLIPLS